MGQRSFSLYIPEISFLFFEVFRRNLKVFAKFWKTNIMFNFIEPLLYLIALGIGLGVYIPQIEGMTYLQFIAPGILASSAMWASSFECTYGSFIRLQVQKIYHAIITTPVSLDEIVLGDMFFGAFKSFFYGSVILLVLSVLGFVSSPLAFFIPPLLFLFGFVIAQLSMIWTSLAPNFEIFAYFFTLIITPMFLFSGVFFPIDNLPHIVQIIAWITPLFHIVELSRGFMTGFVSPLYWLNILMLLLFSLVLFLPPLALMKRRLIQ